MLFEGTSFLIRIMLFKKSKKLDKCTQHLFLVHDEYEKSRWYNGPRNRPSLETDHSFEGASAGQFITDRLTLN